MSKLTPMVVHSIFEECLFTNGESSDDAILVEGIVTNFGFHPERLAKHADQISELLAELPEQFNQNTGGGWAFGQASMDRHGQFWTGDHRTMEILFCLGIAIKKAKWLLPRKLWSALPGGLPYYVIE